MVTLRRPGHSKKFF